MIEYPDRTAMDIVIAIVRRRLHHIDCLTPFGRRGDRHTLLYADQVSRHDVWEWKSELEPDLRANLPKARITICDSYEEIKLHYGQWNLVVIDNNLGDTNHPEDLDLYPAIYPALQDHAFICQCSCLLKTCEYWGARAWDDDRLKNARMDFYGELDIDDNELRAVHQEIAWRAGFETGLELVMRRKHGLHYYLRELKRR